MSQRWLAFINLLIIEQFAAYFVHVYMCLCEHAYVCWREPVVNGIRVIWQLVRSFIGTRVEATINYAPHILTGCDNGSISILFSSRTLTTEMSWPCYTHLFTYSVSWCCWQWRRLCWWVHQWYSMICFHLMDCILFNVDELRSCYLPSANFFSFKLFSQVIQQIEMHGKIKAWGSFTLNAKRVSTRVQKNPNQPLLLEMMYVSLLLLF